MRTTLLPSSDLVIAKVHLAYQVVLENMVLLFTHVCLKYPGCSTKSHLLAPHQCGEPIDTFRPHNRQGSCIMQNGHVMPSMSEFPAQSSHKSKWSHHREYPTIGLSEENPGDSKSALQSMHNVPCLYFFEALSCIFLLATSIKTATIKKD